MLGAGVGVVVCGGVACALVGVGVGAVGCARVLTLVDNSGCFQNSHNTHPT